MEERHAPDIIAEGSHERVLIEVETRDSINDDHTEDQWQLFSAFAAEKGYGFVVLVPVRGKEAEGMGKELVTMV